ncbi:hypothetical protein [uncultured Abyssibacter sp.]|uniref:alpha/beta hydrolase n=1 Tax=uncultured Abyssibacter sp. TaxID=2320202 RepID=UPI0032B2F0CA
MKHWLAGVLALGLLVGCSVDDEAEEQALNEVALSLFDPVAASAVVPFPIDAFFSGFIDPTLNVPNGSSAPFVTAANEVDGFSTTSPIFTDLLGFVDFSTTAQGVIVINTATGTPLVPGIDYVVEDYPVIDDADGVPINQKRTRLLIQPLRPLAPETRYVVALTRALQSEAGIPARPSALFEITASATPVSEQTAPALTTLTDAQKATLEALRAQIIRPTVGGLAAAGIPESSLVLAWPFTTQSIGKSLAAVDAAATAAPLGVQPVPNGVGGTLNTGNLGLGLPAVADIYAGTFQTQYYLQAASAENPTGPLSGFWLADPAQPDTNATFLGQVPCGAFAVGAMPPGFSEPLQPSTSTTTCFPVPVAQSTQTIPVLVTVPNGNSGQTMPDDGWPVVIFQHGITRNRTDMFPVAPTLAAAGFVVIAIDHPLHGITPGSSVAGFRIPGVAERTFDVDYVNNETGAAGPDGQADASGQHFVNLSSLLTARDNIRQSVADLTRLSKSVGLLDFDGDPQTDEIDETRVSFVGHSLGGIVGTTLLGVNSTIGPATLAMPGGGITKLLDGSVSFGPSIAAGLAASGLNEGGDLYETFQRFAQLVLDTADPINHAAAARDGHPIHMIEVLGDQVVPNNVPAGPATAANDRVTIAGPLGGTDPLYMQMGLDVVDNVDPGVTQTQIVSQDANGVGAVVRFTEGDHGSILDPSASPDATTEMQTEMALFLIYGGACLPVGQTCNFVAQ